MIAAGSPSKQYSAHVHALHDLCGDLVDYRMLHDNLEVIPAAAIPPPARALLEHNHHMTQTLERFYGSPVTLRVIRSRRTGDRYRRMIFLEASERRIVEIGIASLLLSALDFKVQREVIEQSAPLGSVLTANRVMTDVRPQWFLRVIDSTSLVKQFGLAPLGELFGRIGVILCEGRPALELLEIVPESPP